MVIENCTVKKSGIPKIEIPVRLKDLNEETIKYYLPQCIGKLQQNAIKIQHFENYVDGTCQDIYSHIYDSKSSGKATNRIVENHAYEITQFKEGFYCGEKVQLTSKKPDNQAVMESLNCQLADIDFQSKIIERWHNQISTGTGITFIMPRGDIFYDIGEGENRNIRYKTTDEGYDVNTNSAFIYETIDNKTNAVVYSSCIGESGLKDLFCFNIANVVNVKTKRTEKVVTVYTREAIYEYKKINGLYELTKIADNYVYGELPMTEHTSNITRISPIEIVYDLLNAINLLVSLDINSVEDKVNQLLVFVNCDIEQTDIDTLYKNGIVCLPPAQGGTINPDVKAITNNLKYTETNVLTERVLTRCFDIVGVPLASATVSSGNNEAAYLGGGWTNASIIAKRDIMFDERYSREELRKIIKICKLNPENPVNNISANDIEIKYNINQSNNLLVKTQSMQNLNDIGIAKEDILKAIPLFNDTASVAKRWNDSIAEKEAKEAEQESYQQSNSGNVDNSNGQPTGDNLTGQQKQQNAQQTQAEQAKSV